MLENFTETQNSNNRIRHLHIPKEDEVVMGATCTHVFILPMLYSESILHSSVIYRQGLIPILEVLDDRFEIVEDAERNCTTITVKLTPEETLRFDYTQVDTQVQMKIVNKDNEVLYNKPNKLIVRKPLDVKDPFDNTGTPQTHKLLQG